MLPVKAIVAPRAASTGLKVPQNNRFPTPAKGPIKPILRLLIAPSSILAPFAFSYSIAAVTKGCILS
jgi:hypothetical protein